MVPVHETAHETAPETAPDTAREPGPPSDSRPARANDGPPADPPRRRARVLTRPGRFFPRRGAEPSRHSLRISIGVAFSLLIVLLGTALITFAHDRHRRIALLTAADLFERGTAQLAADVSALYAPAETLVNLTATLAAEAPDLLADRDLLRVHLAETLVGHPHLEAAFVGEADGSFFLLRNVYDVPGERTLGITLPSGTRYVSQSVERDGTGERYELRFLDIDLEPLGPADSVATGYDPRAREWYRRAVDSPALVHTDFYTFFTSGETGTTIARRVGDSGSVFGVDVTLASVSGALRALSPSPSADIVVFTEEGKLLGSDEPGRLMSAASGASGTAGAARTSVRVDALDEPVLDALFGRFVEGMRGTVSGLDVAGEPWFASIRPVRFGSGGERAFMAIAVPEREMLAALERVRLQSAALALLVLALAILFAWYLSGSVSVSAARLAAEAREMTRLRFDAPITVRSRIAEIDELARAMSIMKSALARFTRVAATLASESSSVGLSRVVIDEARAVSRSGAARVLLLSDDGTRLVAVEPGGASGPDGEGGSIPSDASPTAGRSASGVEIRTAPGEGGRVPPEVLAVNTGRTVVVDAVPVPGSADGAPSPASRLVVPLTAPDETAIGVLVLDAADGVALRTDEESVRFVESLAVAAAVAIRNRQLIEAQHMTFDSLIRLLGAAIDAKSPYTGRHCQRVPLLTERLARAASESDAPPFRDFHLDERRARELHVASWLHDCGKVTTPEHIVDKATKLECVHDRVHEIRTRFEVLRRDAEIAFLRAVDGAPDIVRTKEAERLEARYAALQEDFAFVAGCNVGSESMTEESVERLHAIARRRWVRHFDDTLGLSSAELARKRRHGVTPPPSSEPLLADRPEHRIDWSERPDELERALHGFIGAVPEHERDLGELHNLSVRYGTLTVEERYRINDHVNQTILMLDGVPFPRELSRVPRIAGNHHEKLDGSGYPRGIGSDELEVEDRIMTIADVFEALTAGDRPYKRAKTLGESLAIMRAMVEEGLLDAALFELFVASDIPRAYAREHLAPEQIDLPLSPVGTAADPETS